MIYYENSNNLRHCSRWKWLRAIKWDKVMAFEMIHWAMKKSSHTSFLDALQGHQYEINSINFDEAVRYRYAET
jgi:hypothetical protein